MRYIFYSFLISLGFILLSCDSKNTIKIITYSKSSQVDTLYITESITELILKKISLNGDYNETTSEIDVSTIGIIKLDDNHSYLTILSPNKVLKISVQSDSTILTNSIADSLLNYLWKSNNEFIAKHQGLIFSTDNIDSVIFLFDNFLKFRGKKIEEYADELTNEEKELLHYQNEARVYSFLFYFGRNIKSLTIEHSFFRFREKIDNSNNWGKTLPQNILYKYEIDYLIKYDSLTSVSSFTQYIDSQTTNKDLADFLKSIYIREIIETPSYWERHQQLFNSQVLEAEILKESKNKYVGLIKKSSKAFYSSQAGVKAYNFTAERIDGSLIKLSDLKGKIVFIDSWASWCGPCISHRPRVLELAKKYKDNPRVEILMISVDAKRDDWVRFLTRRNQLENHEDLIIENGLQTDFCLNFNIKAIPRYILIDEFGTIIKSDISEPSIVVENMIEKELNRMSKIQH